MTPLPDQQQQPPVVVSEDPLDEQPSKSGEMDESMRPIVKNSATTTEASVPKEHVHAETVETAYGTGTVTAYRGSTDKMYTVQLKGATLYTNKLPSLHESSPSTMKQPEQPTDEAKTDKTPLSAKKEAAVSEQYEETPTKKSEATQSEATHQPEARDTDKTEAQSPPNHPLVIKKQTTMELDVAYQALEKMRILNLEMECFARGVEGTVDSHKCTKCLLTVQKQERFPRLQKFVDNTKSEQNTGFSRIQKTLWADHTKQQKEKSVVLPRIQRLMDKRQRALANPCLICASPSCPKHSSAVFRKENITLCHSCECFFELDFISDCVSNPNPTERARHVDRMIDLYDRSLLLLRYSSQYIDEVAAALEQNTKKQNKIGLGSSGAGIVSGALGIAAAATILTPAGPPLLIASLLFGGSATAVQTGTEAMNYYSEPSKLADRVIALYGISKSLLRVTSTLRDIIARHGRMVEGDDKNEDVTIVQEHVEEHYIKNKQGLVAASTVGQGLTLGSAAGSAAEVGAIGGARSATALSRAGTAAARTARFARFAGGALSAAVLVMEANAIQSTVKQIRAGNPCEKAEVLRKIIKELDEFPSTDTLEGECRAYLETLDRPVKIVKDKDQFCEPGVTILDGEDPESMEHAAASDSKLLSSSAGGRSLIERIKMHKDRQSSTVGNVDSSSLQDKGLRDLDLDLIS